MAAAYLDTSALVKPWWKSETSALIAWIDAEDLDFVSSDLARSELLRAVHHVRADRLVRASEVLDSVTLLELPTQIFEEAARIDPPECLERSTRCISPWHSILVTISRRS